MDRNQFFSFYDQEVRIDFTPPWAQKETQDDVIRLLKPVPGSNSIAYCCCHDSQADAIIQEQVRRLSALGRPFTWAVFEHDRPPDLKNRLAAHGFIQEESESFMLLDLQEAPASLLEPLEADVRRVARQEQVEDICAIMQVVWGGDIELRKSLFAYDMSIPGYMSGYVGYAGSAPACAGRVYYFPGGHFAALRGGCTLPEYRGGGLYTAVLAARVQDAARRGYRFLTIEASSMSAPIVARRGFQFLEFIDHFKYEIDYNMLEQAPTQTSIRPSAS